MDEKWTDVFYGSGSLILEVFQAFEASWAEQLMRNIGPTINWGLHISAIAVTEKEEEVFGFELRASMPLLVMYEDHSGESIVPISPIAWMIVNVFGDLSTFSRTQFLI